MSNTKYKITTYGDFCEINSIVTDEELLEIPNNIGGLTVKRINIPPANQISDFKTLILPDTLEVICDLSFSCNEALTDVFIPSSLTYLGVGAFVDSGSLTNVIFEEPTSLSEISRSCFGGNASLKHILIPEGVCELSDYSFYMCTNLEEISLPKSLTEIGAYAFFGCKRLRRVYFAADRERFLKIKIDEENNCLFSGEIIFTES